MLDKEKITQNSILGAEDTEGLYRSLLHYFAELQLIVPQIESVKIAPEIFLLYAEAYPYFTNTADIEHSVTHLLNIIKNGMLHSPMQNLSLFSGMASGLLLVN